MTATGWCDGLRTMIAFALSRPQPSVTPGTVPLWGTGARFVNSDSRRLFRPRPRAEWFKPVQRGDLKMQAGGNRHREAVIAVAQGVGFDEDPAFDVIPQPEARLASS